MPDGSRQPRTSVALIAARYELVRELRVGADSLEWEAFDTALERPVVLQLLRPELANDAEAAARFWTLARSNARATRAVGDRVLDAGTDPESGQAFVVRERLTDAPAVTWQPMPRPRKRTPRAPPRWVGLGAVALMLVVVGVGLKPGLDRLLAWVNEPIQVPPGLGLIRSPGTPLAGNQTATTRVTPAAGQTAIPGSDASVPTRPPTVTAVSTRAATPTPLSDGQPRRVVNTDGRGVALRAMPGGDRLPGKGYDEGATVQAFEQSGEWTHIRGSDGREGWVLTVTLAP